MDAQAAALALARAENDAMRAQIDATAEVGAPGYMLWDPSNRYTPAALRAE